MSCAHSLTANMVKPHRFVSHILPRSSCLCSWCHPSKCRPPSSHPCPCQCTYKALNLLPQICRSWLAVAAAFTTVACLLTAHCSSDLQMLLSTRLALGRCPLPSKQHLQAAQLASCGGSFCFGQVLVVPVMHSNFLMCRLHNLAHVELNAVDLAWDTVARFSHLNLDQVSHLLCVRHELCQRPRC